MKLASSRRAFTPEEDVKLLAILREFPSAAWDVVAAAMPNRSARQCRERYVNYLSPDIRVGPWTEFEDRMLIDKVNELGHQWACIGQDFHGRSENDVKNRWYSHLKFRAVLDQGTGKLAMTETPQDVRKKRQRAAIPPQQAAHRILNERSRPPLAEPAAAQTDSSLFDTLDRNLARDVAEDIFGLFGCPPDFFM
jgi:hypothetical protein